MQPDFERTFCCSQATCVHRLLSECLLVSLPSFKSISETLGSLLIISVQFFRQSACCFPFISTSRTYGSFTVFIKCYTCISCLYSELGPKGCCDLLTVHSSLAPGWFDGQLGSQAISKLDLVDVISDAAFCIALGHVPLFWIAGHENLSIFVRGL